MSPHGFELWLLFLDSQAHWRYTHAGHIEALDVAGFAAALQLRQRTMLPDDFEVLQQMWNTQRYAVNERVAAQIAAAQARHS